VKMTCFGVLVHFGTFCVTE